MKRFISVLAIALILILAAWDNASSRRYPEIRIDEPVYDHPWGGEQNNPDIPVTYSSTTFVKNDLTITEILRTWNYRFFFNGSTFLSAGSRRISSTANSITTTTDPVPTTRTNPSTSQGGAE